MPIISVDIKIYEILGYVKHRGQFIVGSNKGTVIKSEEVKELFKSMVEMFKEYNKKAKGKEKRRWHPRINQIISLWRS